MLVVDSSVWIAFLKNESIPQVQLLSNELQYDQVIMCDIILMEVLRGITNEQQFLKVKSLFLELENVEIANQTQLTKSVDWFRLIRKAGYTIRSQNDILIALFCSEMNISLLHNDKDFNTIANFYHVNFA